MRFYFFALFLMPTVTFGEAFTLLKIPLNDGSHFEYVVDLKEKCSFRGVIEIKMPQLELPAGKDSLADKIGQIQKEFNLDIEESEITNESITFSIKAAENMAFEFYFKKSNCELVKVLHVNNKNFNMKAIEIDYNTFLKSPFPKKITIISNKSAIEDLYLYPWALRGQMSLYELNVGPALNIHTNIRVNNTNRFEKNNPVVEPIPGFFFRYGPIFLNKNGLGSLLYNAGDFSIIGMGILEGEPYRGLGLQERNQGLYLGTIFKYNLAELTYYNDFFKDKGYNLKLNIAPEFYYRLSWKFTPHTFIQYWDNRYVDYFFGVKPEETASSGMRRYQGTHTLNYGTKLEVMHFKGKWTFLNELTLKFYGKEVYSSPTVSEKKEVRFITSVLYKFL